MRVILATEVELGTHPRACHNEERLQLGYDLQISFPPMPANHLVRVGAMGQVGRFQAVDAALYPRRARVIVRTRRGLEIGHVLDAPNDAVDDGLVDGQILRGMTVQDHLLEARLERHRQEAYAACVDLLTRNKLPATLVDVEHLPQMSERP